MAKLIPHEKFDRIVALQGEGHRTPRELAEGTGVFIWVVTSIAKGNHYYQRREKKPLTGLRAPGIKTGAHVPYLPTPEEIAELCAEIKKPGPRSDLLDGHRLDLTKKD